MANKKQAARSKKNARRLKRKLKSTTPKASNAPKVWNRRAYIERIAQGISTYRNAVSILAANANMFKRVDDALDKSKDKMPEAERLEFKEVSTKLLAATNESTTNLEDILTKFIGDATEEENYATAIPAFEPSADGDTNMREWLLGLTMATYETLSWTQTSADLVSTLADLASGLTDLADEPEPAKEDTIEDAVVTPVPETVVTPVTETADAVEPTEVKK